MPTFAEKCADLAAIARASAMEIRINEFHQTVVPVISKQLEVEAKLGNRGHVIGSRYVAYNELIKAYYETPLMGFTVKIENCRAVICW